jgi:Iap family predicted aminopeptidase
VKTRRHAELLARELGFGDIVAGSDEEKNVLEKLRGLLESLGLQVEKYSFKCTSWREKRVSLSSSQIEFNAVAMPNSPSGSVYARAVYIGDRILQGEFEELDLAGKVAIVKMFSKIDEISWQYLWATVRGAEAVVFVDPYPGRRRRIVLAPSLDYSFSVGSPPAVPSVSVSLEEGLKLAELASKNEKVHLEVETSISHSAETGVIAAGTLDGPVFTAHADKWLSGFTDNVLGLSIVASLAEKYREKAGYIIFGAEEYGAPGHSPWYWIWGSRSFTSLLEQKGRMSELGLVINFDTLGGGNITISASGPDLLHSIEETLGNAYTYTPDRVIFDSFSFTMHGHPALTIHTFEDTLPVYHTDVDVVENVNWLKVEEAVRIAENIAEQFASNKWKMLDYSRLISPMREKAMKLGHIEEALELLKLLDNVDVKTEDEARHLRKMLTKPVFTGRYGEAFEDPVVAYPYPLTIIEELQLLEESLKEGTPSCKNHATRITKTVPGWETKLLDIEIPRKLSSSTREELKHITAQLAREYFTMLKDFLLEMGEEPNK